jgi:hypothetical protein
MCGMCHRQGTMYRTSRTSTTSSSDEKKKKKKKKKKTSAPKTSQKAAPKLKVTKNSAKRAKLVDEDQSEEQVPIPAPKCKPIKKVAKSAEIFQDDTSDLKRGRMISGHLTGCAGTDATNLQRL